MPLWSATACWYWINWPASRPRATDTASATSKNMQRGRPFGRPLRSLPERAVRFGLVVHTARHGRSGRALLLRLVGDEGLGGEDHAGDAGRILDRRARHLGRVDDAGAEHVD